MPVATMNLSTEQRVETSLRPVPPCHPQLPLAEREFFRDLRSSHIQLPVPNWDSRLLSKVSLRTDHSESRLYIIPAA